MVVWSGIEELIPLRKRIHKCLFQMYQMRDKLPHPPLIHHNGLTRLPNYMHWILNSAVDEKISYYGRPTDTLDSCPDIYTPPVYPPI